MALRSASLWLVVLVAVALRESCSGASSHSLKYFFTSISDPNQGQPQHVAVGFVDGQVFIHYDSLSRRLKPRVSWMEKVDPNYWDRNTQMARHTEEASRGDLETLRLRYNQSKKPPVVTVSSRKEVEDEMETHFCRVHGFYPREIDASWKRDGEIWLEDTFRGFVVPNADGTYHYWLSIRISPKERDHYWCHVEHDGLQEPLDVALKEPTNSKSHLGIIISCVVVAVGLVCLIAKNLLVFLKRRQDDYKKATTSDNEFSNSEEGNTQSI